MAKIFVTGATGFIGKRLVHYLLDQGHEVYPLLRIKGIPFLDHPLVHPIFGDLRDLSTCDPLPKDLDVAYYLIHSMSDTSENLQEMEKISALHFIQALETTQCKQMIYLGGIIEDPQSLSPHLESRLLVEKTLAQSHIPLTILRSSIIIGAGSASFEIIRDLVEKLPVMVAPKWIKTLCQPIFIRDVLFYLNGVLLNPKTFGKTFDIGGPEVLSFKQVLLRYAAFRKLKRLILEVPVLTPRLSSYWLMLISSVRFSLCSYLVESMRHSSRKQNCEIDLILPHQCVLFEEALRTAFEKIAQNAVISSWMDSWDLKKIAPDIRQFIEVPTEGCLRDVRSLPIQIPIEEVKKRIWKIGGDTGWYSMNFAWKLRGLIDKLLGGAGLNRGRRHPFELEVGESIDFWRVLLADYPNGHLILHAEMILPGEAWLEFSVDAKNGIFKQTATFRPRGVWGRTYWFILTPFHYIIFRQMAKKLCQKKVI